jgi:hypothetical protein
VVTHNIIGLDVSFENSMFAALEVDYSYLMRTQQARCLTSYEEVDDTFHHARLTGNIG